MSDDQTCLVQNLIEICTCVYIHATIIKLWRKLLRYSKCNRHRQILHLPWYCDRGLVARRYGKLVCFCPPSYFGYRCEKHSHRLTVIFTLNIDTIKADLIRIVVLLINGNVTIDHILITQEPSYTGKHRLYLNYPRSLYSNLRQMSNNYIVQIRVYTVSYNIVKLSFVLQYPIKYSFLPAYRIAVVLRDKDNLLLKDQSHTRYSYDFENHYTQSLINCPCAPGSKCLLLENQHVTCICASQQYGPTCHLTTTPCPTNFCYNDGTCISYRNDFHTDKYRCSCMENNFGNRCQYNKSILSLNLHKKTSSVSSIIPSCQNELKN